MVTAKTQTKRKTRASKAGAASGRVMEAVVYNRDGKEVERISLPEKIFGVKANQDVLHQVITTLTANARTPVAHTKDRGDVSGGGKKPWRQKGTGRARHGSIRSPIWRGGGVTFGPRNDKNYKRDLNRKVKAKALAMILSTKWNDGEIIFVDSLGIDKPKTKLAQELLGNLAKEKGREKINYKKGKRALITTPGKDDAVVKSFRNIGSSTVEEVRNIDPLKAMSYRYIVIVNPKESLETLAKRVNF